MSHSRKYDEEDISGLDLKIIDFLTIELSDVFSKKPNPETLVSTFLLNTWALDALDFTQQIIVSPSNSIPLVDLSSALHDSGPRGFRPVIRGPQIVIVES